MLAGLGLFSLKKRRLGEIPSICINTWREGMKKRDPDSSQQSPLTRQEAMGINQKMWNSSWTQNTFLLWGWSKSGMSCPERLWSLYPLKLNRTGPWATFSGWLCSEQRGLDWTICRSPFPPRAILWFSISKHRNDSVGHSLVSHPAASSPERFLWGLASLWWSQRGNLKTSNPGVKQQGTQG